ncbi:MAG: BlaI/MecI/CopY family transcriptional regulator [Flavobacterium sp.]|nr:BlaI/MecI/CopY family transcriptional regulator [Flavobacterium sp.]
MQKLTTKEEEIMQVLWKLEKAFVKEILAEITGEQHYNTLSTLVRIMEDKGFVAHNSFGNTHQYYPLISKEEYKKKFMNVTIDNYFNSSYKNMVSFFAKENKITAEELREILEMVEKQNENQ